MEEKKTSKILLNELLDRHYKSAEQAKERGELVAWATSIAPQELLTTTPPGTGTTTTAGTEPTASAAPSATGTTAPAA